MALTFASINEEATISGFTLRGDVTERLAVYMEDMGVKFTQTVGIVHTRTVFQILVRLLRLCPVDTGRLRGSWTTFMEAMSFGGYQKYLQQPSLSSGTAKDEEVKKGFSELEVSRGRELGAFVNDFLNTSISSNVVYAAAMNERYGYLNAALIWGDARYQANMEAFLKATAMKEAVFNPVSVNDDGQGGL